MKINKWISAWCSVQGSSHRELNLPCQDNAKIIYQHDKSLIFAAVSDGAGSCENSQLGSEFLVSRSIELLESSYLFETVDIEKIKDGWREEAFNIFTTLKLELKEKADSLNVDLKSLSATLIAVVSNGEFVACANIGDGRATFRDADGNWHPLLVPVKGEEVNQTLFVTSELWDKDKEVELFGTSFYWQSVKAIALLSDGCERACFEVLKYDQENNKYFDPNNPFKPFFEPNYTKLLQLDSNNISQEKINKLWTSFIESGNEKLSNEMDDKTIILSVFKSDD